MKDAPWLYQSLSGRHLFPRQGAQGPGAHAQMTRAESEPQQCAEVLDMAPPGPGVQLTGRRVEGPLGLCSPLLWLNILERATSALPASQVQFC